MFQIIENRSVWMIGEDGETVEMIDVVFIEEDKIIPLRFPRGWLRKYCLALDNYLFNLAWKNVSLLDSLPEKDKMIAFRQKVEEFAKKEMVDGLLTPGQLKQKYGIEKESNDQI